jgi:hypothetical protein
MFTDTPFIVNHMIIFIMISSEECDHNVYKEEKVNYLINDQPRNVLDLGKSQSIWDTDESVEKQYDLEEIPIDF